MYSGLSSQSIPGWKSWQRTGGDSCTYNPPSVPINYADPQCASESNRLNSNGWLPTNYDGKIKTTFSGKECQKWSLSSPHQHEQQILGKKGIYGSIDHNYCRANSNDGGAWCYTTDSNLRREYCSCPGNNQ